MEHTVGGINIAGWSVLAAWGSVAAAIATATILYVILHSVRGQATKLAEHAALTAQAMKDQSDAWTLKVVLRFHEEFTSKQAMIVDLIRKLEALPRNEILPGADGAALAQVLNWIDTYGEACRIGLIKNPAFVVGQAGGNLWRLLKAG